MNRLTITKRLWILIACALAAVFAVGIIGYTTAVTALQGIANIRDDSLVSIKVLGELNSDFQRFRVNAYAHVASTSDAEMAELEKRLKDFEGQVKDGLKQYEKLANSPEDKTMLEADRKALESYFALFNGKVLPVSRKSETAAALALMQGELRTVARDASDALAKHIELNDKTAGSYANSVASDVTRAQQITLALLIAASVGVALMGYFIVTGINKSLAQIQDNVGRTERDLDFTLRTAILREDEIGVTAKALNRLIERMQDNLKGIQTRAQTVAQSAAAMSTTSGQVATAAHQQSEAASNMAATIEEMTVSINHVGDRALEADRISNESGRLAQSGETIIGRTVKDINKISATVNDAAESIRSLEKSSQEIANVVAVIKEVADQTNLLALNAAIEAARAGEQGRGFAVVADEVRKLAERTSTSTQEIAATIETMRSSAGKATTGMNNVVVEVEHGVDSAREASEAIRQIGEGSRQTMDMVAEITTAIKEQASAMNSIAQQVERIAQMSEESSAAAENSAHTAQQLDTLASEVQTIVRAYKL